MHMWFWTGNNLGSFLFPGYNVNTSWGLFCTCLGLAALAVSYEGMKILHIKLQQCTKAAKRNAASRSSENSLLLSRMARRPIRSSVFSSCSNCCAWNLQVLHWSAHTFLGYILMMAVMTYNVYIGIALVLGSGIGYWVFGPKLIELNMEHFHQKEKTLECDKECSDNIVNQQRQGSTISIVAEQLVTEATVEVHAAADA